MYARVISGQILPGKTDGWIRNYQAGLPFMEEQKGYQNAYLLVDHKSGKYASISLWGTEEDRRASEPSHYLPESIRQEFEALRAAPSTTELYEVAVRA
jgi:hypothetical protein